jgi:hypothetical protein
MKEETVQEKKQIEERTRLIERARQVTERAAISCEQFAAEAEKIERDSAFFIDTINQQEGLFASLKEFARGGKGIH